MSTGNSIRNISDTDTFKEFLNNNVTTNQLYVIDFHATWCKPCKRVSPLYDKLCSECDNVIYFKCDVDEAEDLAEVFEVKSVPTFIFAYNRNILDKMEGANIDKIKSKINELVNTQDRKYTLLRDSNTNEEASDDEGDDQEDDTQEDDDQEDDEQEDDDQEDDDQEYDDQEDEDQEDDAQEDDDQEDDDQEDDAQEDDDQEDDAQEDDVQEDDAQEDDDQDDDNLMLDDLSKSELIMLIKEIGEENIVLRKNNKRLHQKSGR